MVVPLPAWYAIWIHSNCERRVCEQLTKKLQEGTLFFPRIKVLSTRVKGRDILKPLFPGYLFLNCLINREIYLEVIKTRGVVKILGEGGDRLYTIPEEEILAIQRFLNAEVSLKPRPYLGVGDRVRIKDGPFVGIEGIIIEYRQKKMVFGISIELLHRSVEVEIDYTGVEPC